MWYAVQTRSTMEMWAQANLRERGFETYLPLYRKRRSHARKVDYRLVPFFPGYLFVDASFELQSIRAVNYAPGVIGVVSFGSRPAVVADHVIDEIRCREGEDGCIQPQHVHKLVSGQRVRIEQGVLSNHVGLFQCDTDEQRVVVLLSILGRDVRAKVPRQSVIPAQ